MLKLRLSLKHKWENANRIFKKVYYIEKTAKNDVYIGDFERDF